MKKPTMSKVIKRVPQIRLAVVGLLFLLFYLLLPQPSRANGPTEQVRATVDKVLAIVRSPNLNPTGQQQDLRVRLAEAINPRFDFVEMAKRSLGSHWGRRTPKEQREFVKIFAGLLGRSYAGNIESYSSQNVVYTGESENQNYAQVDTKIVVENHPPQSINYKLHSVNNEWKVYDLVIEDISVVDNYRSQFDRVIARSSFEELVRLIEEKQS